MKITINDIDRTAEMGDALAIQAEQLRRGQHPELPVELPENISPHYLAGATDEADFTNRFISLIRLRNAVGMHNWRPHPQRGLLGRLKTVIQALIWRLGRPRDERIIFRQNIINDQLTAAIAYEQEVRQREIEWLRRKVAALEEASTSGEGGER